ncbi:DUF6233 domain-containing protein [Streptomyces antimicrobicus]|uniref:DUF6233 domain-containing protein n=1 Tax=Streptomyces antimicrobicus TaxID=2883108 RepID=A0ABS8BB88_9ACTN|nr:DUF6233 domain-containing protein [Streptomyces antimicrobicus]MCB5181874.1 DUF6233 domain-containing protein [Streptomyces antimicrobicus]
MSVLPPDPPRLRTLVTYLRGELQRAETALLAAEEREALTARSRTRRDPPAWLVERGIGAGRPAVRLHVGGCWDTGNRCAAASSEQLRQLLAEGIPACPHCRPDTALGVLE